MLITTKGVGVSNRPWFWKCRPHHALKMGTALPFKTLGSFSSFLPSIIIYLKGIRGDDDVQVARHLQICERFGFPKIAWKSRATFKFGLCFTSNIALKLHYTLSVGNLNMDPKTEVESYLCFMKIWSGWGNHFLPKWNNPSDGTLWAWNY